VIGVVAAFAVGVSSAFFCDAETSRDNTFQAGELDLKIDNTSYYNGVLWPDTTWSFDEDMKLFFNFLDLKPGDYGEDTISLHVQNDACVCMSITKTADDDVTCTEPELLDDPDCAER
jgi:predicted ribosomally synthesized peptide with SipW-like signal peptide